VSLEELLTVKQVAEVLKISRQAVYSLVARRRISCVRFSRRGIRFRVEDFEEWLNSKTIKDQRGAYGLSYKNSKKEGESYRLDSQKARS
jgi:excisionase family DNA binding protein